FAPLRPPPRSTLFPYTTLFRSRRAVASQPADRPPLARDHAERREPHPGRVLAPGRRARWTGLRARGDGRRRGRGRRRPRPHRGDGAPRPRARRRPGERPPRVMVAGAWVCLLAPLVGCVTIALAGQTISRRMAGW